MVYFFCPSKMQTAWFLTDSHPFKWDLSVYPKSIKSYTCFNGSLNQTWTLSLILIQKWIEWFQKHIFSRVHCSMLFLPLMSAFGQLNTLIGLVRQLLRRWHHANNAQYMYMYMYMLCKYCNVGKFLFSKLSCSFQLSNTK